MKLRQFINGLCMTTALTGQVNKNTGPSELSRAGGTLLPEVVEDPMIDSSQWEAYQTEGPYSEWRKWLNPGSRDRTLRQSTKLPPAHTLLPSKAIAIPEIVVEKFLFKGNTVFPDHELRILASPFLKRPLSRADLDLLASRITRHYIAGQYFNSGTRLSPEDFENGILTVDITEGTLTQINLLGNMKLHDSFIKNRLLGSPGKPFHFPELSRRVQILQQDPNIRRINAELKPGTVPGQALLQVDLFENEIRWKRSLTFNNRRPSSIGAEQLDFNLEHSNLTGVSDHFRFRYGIISRGIEDPKSSKFDNFSASYSRPLNRIDTTLHLSYARQDYTILDEPFNALDISGLTQQASLGVSHPVIHTLNDRVNFFAHLDHSYSYSELLGEPFSLSEGFVNGRLRLSSLRFGADWLRRKDDHVIALQASFRFGLPWLESTEVRDGPDAAFTLFQLNGQYLKRMHGSQDILVIKGGLQFAFDEIPSPLKNTMGGSSTIRGYRENSLVRDSGAFVSLEYQHRLLPDRLPSSFELDLIPFIDAGIAWDRRDSQSETLSSIGLGLRATYLDRFRAEVFYGIPLNSRPLDGDSLQDQGFHFQMSLLNF